MSYTFDTVAQCSAYNAGVAGDDCPCELVLEAFWRAGRGGFHPPCKAIGYRIGAVPTSGRSYNFRDERFERGVSLLWDSESGYESDGTYQMFNRGRIVWVEGYVLIDARGSDREPLMVGAVQIRKPRKLPADCPLTK
jgi:hypothetical protein